MCIRLAYVAHHISHFNKGKNEHSNTDSSMNITLFRQECYEILIHCMVTQYRDIFDKYKHKCNPIRKESVALVQFEWNWGNRRMGFS